MNVGLFIPCYVNQFYPQVAIATLELLEKYNCKVGYPLNQTCCGQPMANSGYEKMAQSCNELFTDNFAEYDFVVKSKYKIAFDNNAETFNNLEP